jgi:AraC-like DNA-binding protein
MQVPASIELSGIVRHYLSFDGEHSVLHRLRLFSDGHMSIVFNASSNLTLDGQLLPDAFIYGQITEYKDIACQGQVRLFVVVFRPDGFNRLFGLPASELKDKVVSFADLFGSQGLRLQQAVMGAVSLSEKIQQTEAFLLRLLGGRSRAADPKIAASLQLIQKHNGAIAIHQLANALCCHTRQLERQFNTVVGLSPKRFCNVVRAHAFLKHLQAHSHLTSKAYDTGYFDQAHLIREFKQITGLTPSQYLKKAVPLAVNLLWIPT